MNAIVAIGGNDLGRIVADYRVLVQSAVWMLGLRAPRDQKDPYKRSLEALIEPFMNQYFGGEAKRQIAAVSDECVQRPLKVREIDPSLCGQAAVATLEAGLAPALALVVMLDRAHATQPIELILNDASTPLARTAAAWGRARGLPVVTIPDRAALARPLEPPANPTLGPGERARRAYEASGIDSASLIFAPEPASPPELPDPATIANRRTAVREAMVRTLGWRATDIVIAFEPATSVRESALDPLDPLGASLVAMFNGFGVARAKLPDLRLVIVGQPAVDGFARVEAAAKSAGFGDGGFAYTDSDHDTWTAGADIVVALDSARAAVAAAHGVPSINLWRPAHWYRGPMYAAEDGVIDASAQVLGATIVALAGDPNLRAQIAAIAFKRNAVALAAAPQVITTIARELVPRRRLPPPKRGPAKPDIVIVAPDFVHWSAGVRALHRLCHLINMRGGNAYVFPATKYHPDWNTPRRESPLNEHTIVVHPESTAKIFEHTRLVRWVLNVPGLLGGPKVYDPDEMVVYFSQSLRAAAQSATPETLTDDHELTIITTDPQLFYNDRSRPRLYDCVYIGKGREIYERVQPRQIRDAFTIARLHEAWPQQRHETAALLRGCRHLYSFDQHTAIVDEAIICGAKVFYVREDGKIKPEFGFVSDHVERFYDFSQVDRFLAVLKKRWG